MRHRGDRDPLKMRRSDSLKDVEFPDWLSYYQLLKMDFSMD